MNPMTALSISGALLTSGTLLLSATGLVPMLLGIANVILYNAVYTGLKRITTFAIVPGAVVGAVPPFIGYTAAGGAMTDTVILLFALFMFLWQIPHFWILLLRYGHEYQKAGIKTLYGAMDNRQIGRLVFLWVTASSLLLWVLTGMFMPLKAPAGLAMLGLNVTFIILFYRIIFKGKEAEGLKSAFILMNTFTLLIMLILIAIS
jgi:protoheme IX farnesyltransferase